jgi:inner membrane transporter RhtA
MPRKVSTLLPVGALLTSVLSFQLGAVLAKQLFPLVGAEGATAIRLGLGALILWVWRRPWRRLPERRGWIPLVGYGLTLGLMNLFFYKALRTLPLGIAVALDFLGPLAVALFGSRRALDLVWVALAVAGLALLLPYRGDVHALDPAGVLYALIAASAGRSTFCWADVPARRSAAMPWRSAPRSARSSRFRSASRMRALCCSPFRRCRLRRAWRC